MQGFPGGAIRKESSCQYRRHKRCGFSPWVGKVPWRSKWQPTPSKFLPGELPWTEAPGGLQSIRSQSQTRLKRLGVTYINCGTDWLSDFESYWMKGERIHPLVCQDWERAIINHCCPSKFASCLLKKSMYINPNVGLYKLYISENKK